MEKESYSIEDILNEAKRQREQKAAGRTDPQRAEAEQEAQQENEIKEIIEQGALAPEHDGETAELSLEETELVTKPDGEEAETPLDENGNGIDTNGNNGENADAAEVFEPEQEEEELPESEPESEEVQPESEPESEEVQPESEPESEEVQPQEDGMVDLLSYEGRQDAPVEEPEEEHREHHRSHREKHGKSRAEKVTTGVILVLVLAIILALGYYFILPYLNMSDKTPRGEDSPIGAEWTGMKDDIRNFPEITEADAGEVSSLQDMMKQWYKNGAPCSASHVLNVLLIGEDTRGGELLEEDTRADSAIIVSVNIDTQTVTMTSILRDTYAYWQVTPGNEETGMYEKINASMALEGCSIETYVSTIENLYKIDIDNYVIVNFECFANIIDELGGVTINMTSAEINEINNHPYRYGDIGEVYIEKTFDGNEGEVDLDGKQALAYCRIRKLDSDNQRAERQKNCLNQMFIKVKDASNTELLKVVNTLAPYVKTGFSTKEILSIAKYALSNDWMQFDIVSTTVPHNRINEKGAGGTYFGFWCWKSDYPADAYYLQTILYGETGITLAENRVDIIRCRDKGYFDDGVLSCLASGQSIYNLDYMVPTTYELTKFGEDEEKTVA